MKLKKFFKFMKDIEELADGLPSMHVWLAVA